MIDSEMWGANIDLLPTTPFSYPLFNKQCLKGKYMAFNGKHSGVKRFCFGGVIIILQDTAIIRGALHWCTKIIHAGTLFNFRNCNAVVYILIKRVIISVSC